MLEYEKKIMLSETEYSLLKNEIYPNSKTIVQTNYYYDTDTQEMNNRGITCRIREIDGIFSVEVKEHNQSWGDCSIENCRSISKRFDDSFFINMKLKNQGKLITERTTIERDEIKLMLDKNTYLGFVDYELEIEYTVLSESQATEELQHIAKALEKRGLINSVQSFTARIGGCRNKASRFFTFKSHFSEV